MSGTNKTDNLTCDIMKISQSSVIASGYFILLEMTVVYIINRKIHGWLEVADLSLVLNMNSFSALTREISCSTLKINLVFQCTKTKYYSLSIYMLSPLLPE